MRTNSAVKLSTIQSKPIDWLWKNRIPRGKITLLAGDPGTGKTALLLHLAAQLSNGNALPPPVSNSSIPNTSTSPCLLVPVSPCPAATLLLSPDDNIADTLRPRLESMHANLDHIHLLPDFHSLIPNKNHNQTAPSPLETLEETIQSLPNLALIAFDPITHYLGLTDHLLHHSHGPRSTLHALAKLAEKYNLAIILTTRLTKKIDPSLPPAALHRALGSLAFAETARAFHLLLPSNAPVRSETEGLINTNDAPPTSHLLLTIKSNCSQLPPPLALTITNTITWHDYLPPKETKKLGRRDTILRAAADWLKLALQDGPTHSTAVIHEARNNAISQSTLSRAKELVGVVCQKQAWSKKWFWRLPDDDRPLPEDPFARNLAQTLVGTAPKLS